ncbi:MAG: ABC transporter ATP-binding protein [Leptolyngbyaceae cyanobacterium MO_188.B28]|nr:ABC transporter ATP-binding protein [Leptolyngbyaceae cyanobacterium MO_188.B28]
MASETILQVTDLVKEFGGVRAVNDVNLTLPMGAITALIGPNGAGKTTLYHLICGRLKPTSGQITLQRENLPGKNITGLPPHAIVKSGIGRSFQITSVFPALTVRQNVRAAAISRMGRQFDWWRRVECDRPLNQAVEKILALVGVQHLAAKPVQNLSHGEQGLVEIALVLALEPRLILLDEPTAGMSREDASRIVQLLRQLNQKTGCAFLITEHDMEVVFNLAETIIVMHQGQIIAAGEPEAIRSNPDVRRAYLGTVPQ